MPYQDRRQILWNFVTISICYIGVPTLIYGNWYHQLDDVIAIINNGEQYLGES